MVYPWYAKAGETPPLIFWGPVRSFWRGLGVQCGRVKVVYFTPRLYRGSGQSCWSAPPLG